MVFKVYEPKPPLNSFIQSFLYYEGFAPDHKIERFLPDGNTEIIFELTGNTKYIYDNDTLEELQACNNVWVSGVRTAPISIPSNNEAKMFIVYFHKGMAFPFYTFPMTHLSDRVVDADTVFKNSLTDMHEMFLACASVKQMFTIAEHFFQQRLSQWRGDEMKTACVRYALQEITHRPDILKLENIIGQIGYSQRHFIDFFKNSVGVNPKTYLKIMRFQKAIVGIERAKKVNWSSVALESGYYDQSHFIHDFKTFSGFAPNEYAQKHIDFLNYVPVG